MAGWGVGKSGMRCKAASPGSEARWREEVMPGRASGGSDAGAFAPGGKNQRKRASKLK
ncbi:hypothetical protein [Mesotoga sp. Brook.08.YT.4.2.5.1]|uniref:hypothetical protein n=1 Tax=Mesotoga sp. Brook.08.YT.4.2.5.1 TaxID=1421001 RepID=UPI002155C382|nr:hypothetical protein [Mesotoga sp. Brook.08.YT.4.2.5.1]